MYLICENKLTLPLFSCNTFILFLSINFMEILQWKCAVLVGGREKCNWLLILKKIISRKLGIGGLSSYGIDTFNIQCVSYKHIKQEANKVSQYFDK